MCANVAEVAVQYRAKNAKKAQRADQRVRDSVQETAQTAREERGTINRWMERHQAAIQTIGVATLATMGAIASASPTLRAELAGVRTAFSLFADTVVRDVLPRGTSLVDLAFRLEAAYRNIPGPIRKVVSALIFFGGTVAGLLAAAGTLQTVLSGTFVATLGGKVLAAIKGAGAALAGSTAAVYAAAVAVGGMLGLLGVYALEWLGALDAVQRFGSFVGNVLPGWVRDGMLIVLSAFLGPLAVAGAAIVGFVRGTLDGGLNEGVRRAGQAAREAASVFTGAWRRTISRVKSAAGRITSGLRSWASGLVSDARNWGADVVDEFASGMRSQISSAIGGAARAARSRIEASLSYDQPANDRAARRWGRDLMEEFSAGVRAGRRERLDQELTAPRPAPGGGGGGSSTTVVFEQGAIQVGSAGSPKRTAQKTAEAVSDTIQDDVGMRR